MGHGDSCRLRIVKISAAADNQITEPRFEGDGEGRIDARRTEKDILGEDPCYVRLASVRRDRTIDLSDPTAWFSFDMGTFLAAMAAIERAPCRRLWLCNEQFDSPPAGDTRFNFQKVPQLWLG